MSPTALQAARAVVPARYRPAIAGAVRPLVHRGDRVACPCCGGHFGSFARHRTRPNAKCPRCGSLERHRLLWLFLSERTDVLQAHLSFLHIAPEYSIGGLLRDRPNLDYRSADLESPLADDHVDVMDLPYADGSFDVVMCNHVLEHVDDDRLAMSELARVVAPGGRLIVLSPIDRHLATTIEDPTNTDPEDRERAYGQFDHQRRYGADFAARLAETGLEVSVVPFIEELEPERVARHGLAREDEVFGVEDLFLGVQRGAPRHA